MTVPAPPSVQAPAPAAPVADAALLLEVPAPVAGAAPVIPPSGVQYLVLPRPIYPRASRLAGEAGRVLHNLLRMWAQP